MLNKFLNRNKTKLTLRVVFRDEAAEHGEHGSLFVDHVQKGLKNEAVSFAFVGVSQMPALDDKVLSHIFDEARAAGYIPLSLRSYATVMTVKPAPNFSFDTKRAITPANPQVFRDQAHAAAKDMSRQHEAQRQAAAVRKVRDGVIREGSDYRVPRNVPAAQ